MPLGLNCKGKNFLCAGGHRFHSFKAGVLIGHRGGKKRTEEQNQFLVPSLRNAHLMLSEMDFARLLVSVDCLNSNILTYG